MDTYSCYANAAGSSFSLGIWDPVRQSERDPATHSPCRMHFWVQFWWLTETWRLNWERTIGCNQTGERAPEAFQDLFLTMEEKRKVVNGDGWEANINFLHQNLSLSVWCRLNLSASEKTPFCMQRYRAEERIQRQKVDDPVTPFSHSRWQDIRPSEYLCALEWPVCCLADPLMWFASGQRENMDLLTNVPEGVELQLYILLI